MRPIETWLLQPNRMRDKRAYRELEVTFRGTGFQVEAKHGDLASTVVAIGYGPTLEDALLVIERNLAEAATLDPTGFYT